MKRRMIAMLLCLVMLGTCMGAALLLPPDIDLIDKASGTAVSEVTVPKCGRVTLTPDYESAAELGYQWQISSDGKAWVSILGQTGESINLSYAMVCNMLSAEGAAQVRCLVASGDDEYESDAVEVTIGEPVSVQPMTEEAAAAPVVLMAAAPADEVMTMAEGDAADVKQTYNIVINYKFENNEIVSDPYTANLAEGSSFSASVTFPTVQGYLPYVNDVQQDLYTFNIASVTEDVTIDVVYKPTNVNYTVIHYQQNVNDDNYTEVERETKQGLTKSTVPEVAKTYEGFYNLLYERPAIAADGSTVIEIYYDRYYYLMNFDMDGGYGTEPVYARYGANIGTVNDPTKAGYTFGGWTETEPTGNKDETVTTVKLPETMPAENKTFYAYWVPEDTARVTFVFWGENADDNEYSYLSSKILYVSPQDNFMYTEDGTLICKQEEHTHTEACYGNCTHGAKHTFACYGLGECKEADLSKDGDGNAAGHFEKTGILKDGVVCHYYNWDWGDNEDFYYIYLDGKYYSITAADYNRLKTGTEKEEHGLTQSDRHYVAEAALSCDHKDGHLDACMNCGKTEHKHGSDCYMDKTMAGLDGDLWTFNKSDKVDIEQDGSSVVNIYYTRVKKTLTFKYSYSSRNGYQKTETITAKWGENIATKYNAIVANAGSSFWSTDSDYSGPYTNYIGIMPQTSKTYYYQSDSGSSGTMYYYGESLTGEYEEMFKVPNVGGYTVTVEDHYDFKGFTYDHGTSNGSSCSGAEFYYTRNTYGLRFVNDGTVVDTKWMKYQAPLADADSGIDPTVPSRYEPGSVKFDGWYLNPECTGSEYILADHIMPASAEYDKDNPKAEKNVALTLYAKWVPVTHTVTFYLDKAAYEAGTKLQSHPAIPVLHGDVVGKVEAPENGKYEFVGWFYMDNGVEKAFDLENMEVRKDLNVYGKWSSNTLMEYTVQFVLKDDHSVKVADDLTGSGLAGTTKTFDAKGGNDLYKAYQEGYFPTVQSQSLLLDIEENNLTVTFEYVPMPAVPYTVKYVEKDTGKILADDKVVSDNRKAVVTETFRPISGYMPDAYQKRLVITADGENVLYFYYSKDTQHAYYKITHYTQNTDGATWTEYASSQVIGDIGTRYKASPMTISGYTYKETKYVVNKTEVTDVTAEGAELTANGLEINLYYTRNEYPYQVRYLEQGTGKQLADPKNGTGKYGEVISESAIDIANYDKVDPSSATLNVRIDEGEGAPKINIITFYYKEKEVTINYVAVGPAGATDFGSVSLTSETPKVLSGTAQGSTASTEGNTFKFVGWYKDAACTEPLSTDAKYTPAKVDGKNVAATYYAKFDYNLTTLTIKKECEATYEESDMFIFTVTDENGEEVAKVAMRAGEKVTISGLTVGETYTVSEDNAWSWRYKEQAKQTITLTADKDANVVTVTNEVDNHNWLSASTYAINKCVKQVGEDVLAIIKNIFGA